MNKNNDITAIVGAETDVAPLGRDTPKPAHELTAAEDRDSVDGRGMQSRLPRTARRETALHRAGHAVLRRSLLLRCCSPWGFLPGPVSTRVAAT
ncbi:MAG: hypothetical protein IPM40_08485 [Gammaproteobacteria bacterium]|nr:hypothetical protein [Gammaproteobacteria bacterium]